MGVFAVFRRKKKDVAPVAASLEETGAVAPAEDGETKSGADAPEAVAGAEAAQAERPVEVSVETAVPVAGEAGSVDGVEEADGVDADDEAVAGAVAAESVEIPKQQSAEAAADNEAGEGARR